MEVKASNSVWHLSDLEGADMSKALLSQADMVGTNLTSANLSDTDVFQTKFDESTQDQCNFQGANIKLAQPKNATYAAYVMTNT